jgi:formate dehydrogenase major subunit
MAIDTVTSRRQFLKLTGTLVNATTANGRTTIVNIEGNPDSPINVGSLCPKGAATFQLAVNPLRTTKVLHRKPGATEWDKEDMTRDQAMTRIAQLYADSRDATFVEKDPNGKSINQTTGIFALGGATNDNEENYLIAKVNRMMGVVRIENQARI